MEYGTLFFTAGVAEEVKKDRCFLHEINRQLFRYQLGDWGDLCEEDRQFNEDARLTGARIMGSYVMQRGGKIWVITEAEDDTGHRAATTVLFPDEY